MKIVEETLDFLKKNFNPALWKRVLDKAIHPFTEPVPPTPEDYRGRIKYNPDKCIGCGLCVRFCPSKTITMKKNKKITLNLTECCYCGTCQEICPTKCIKLSKELTPNAESKENKEWKEEIVNE